jgi:excisionase family DNA binding protein
MTPKEQGRKKMRSAAASKRVTVAAEADPDFWTAKHVSEHVKADRDWVYRHAKEGHIPSAYKFGGGWRFDPAAVREWFQAISKPVAERS